MPIAYFRHALNASIGRSSGRVAVVRVPPSFLWQMGIYVTPHLPCIGDRSA